MLYPKVRAIEPLATEGDRFYLRDPLRMSDAILLVPRPVLYILSLLDGKHSVDDVRTEFARAAGQAIARERIDEILSTLDEALFLDNERFRAVQARIVREFHVSDLRPAIHAGLSYPSDPKELADMLGNLLGAPRSLSRAEGRDDSGSDPRSLPGLGGEPAAAGPEPAEGGAGADGRTRAGQSAKNPAPDVEAIVAPHIDLNRGGACYAAVYRQVALRAQARRFIVLGISHHPLTHAYALTTKDYDTPFGRVRTDRAFVERLAVECGTDFLADEIAHREEHSVEFQVLFLKYLLGGYSGLCEEREFTVVPILCASLHDHVERGVEPEEGGEVAQMLAALDRLLGRREGDCLIAAVDFAHLGRQFGQDLVVTEEVIHDAEAADRRMMEAMTDRDASGFFRLIADEKDRRNVCGVPAIYALLRLIGSGDAGAVARYGQAVDRKAHSVVTFAGLVFPRRAAT